MVALTLKPLTCPRSTINILVEEDGKSQKFTMHRDLLSFYSPYFRGIFKDRDEVVTKKSTIRVEMHKREWRWEDKENVEPIIWLAEGELKGDEDKNKIEVDVRVKIPEAVREIRLNTSELGEVSRIVFAAFVNWLYHGYAGFGLNGVADKQMDAVTLIQLWVFAGRIGVPECQNHCIEGIEWWRQTSNIIQTSMLRWVYDNTMEYVPQKCPLRSLLIDQCAWKLDGTWLLSEIDGRKNEEQFPREALVDLVSRMRVVLNEGMAPPFLNSECRKRAYWIEVEEKRVAEVLERTD